MLSTNVSGWQPQELRQAVVQPAQAEAACRIQNKGHRLGTIWHQKVERVQAHILACFLAYGLWETLEQ